MKYIYILAINFITLGFFTQTQVGPGGVGDATTIAFWLDASQLGLADGDPVPAWTDRGGNANDFTQGTPSRQPTYTEASLLNGLPALRFDGTDFLSLGALPMMDNSFYSFYGASTLTSTAVIGSSKQMCLIEASYGTINPHWLVQYRKQGSTQGRLLGNSRNTPSTASSASMVFPSLSDLATTRVTSFRQVTPSSLLMYSNDQFASASDANLGIGTSAGFNIGRVSVINGNYINGDMNDIIVYNTALNDAQDIIVQNFLATKYNVSLGGLSKYDFAGTYPNELAGIGREDASNEHLSARGSSIVEITAASLDDDDYLLWGHDAGGFTPTTVNIPASYVGTGNRLPQEWRFTENGETGDVTLTFDVSGISFGGTTDYELLIDDDGNFTDALAISGTYLADIVTFNVTAAQINDQDYFTLGNSTGGSLITSIADGQDWSDPTTWDCTCIPDNGFSVVIDDGHTVTVSGDETAHNLTVNATGELVIDANAELSLTSNMSVLGTFTSNSLSSLNFNGNSFQTIDIPGSTDLGSSEVDNPAGVIFNTGTYSFFGTFTPTLGDVDFGGNDITFASDATGTAVIGVVGAGASFSGTTNIKVQRFIPAGIAGFRSIGTPLTSMTMREWDDEVFISGTGFPDGCSYTANGCYHSVKYWRSDLQSYRTVNDLDSNILSGSGIEIFLGDNLSTFSATTLTAAGIPNIAVSVDIPVQNGWNYISNPFLSPIDFDNITRNDAVGTGNYCYVYDPSITGFRYWDGNGQTASDPAVLVDGVLSSFQGFWMFHTGAASTITIDQNSKSINANDNFLRNGEGFGVHEVLTMELNSQDEKQKALGMLKFSNEKKSVPERLPNFKVAGLSTVSVYTADAEGNDWVVNELINSGDCFELPVYVDVLSGGEYSITFENIYDDYDVYATNNATKVTTRVISGTTVDFEMNEGDIDRGNPITLSFKKKNTCFIENDIALFDVYTTSDNISISTQEPLNEDVIINVFNMVGSQTIQQIRMNKESSNVLVNSSKLSGMYLVSITDLNGQVVKVEKVFIEN